MQKLVYGFFLVLLVGCGTITQIPSNNFLGVPIAKIKYYDGCEETECYPSPKQSIASTILNHSSNTLSNFAKGSFSWSYSNVVPESLRERFAALPFTALFGGLGLSNEDNGGMNLLQSMKLIANLDDLEVGNIYKIEDNMLDPIDSSLFGIIPALKKGVTTIRRIAKESRNPNTRDALVRYAILYSANRYFERNGKKKENNTKTSAETSASEFDILFEFLGDHIFKVPYYSPEIIEAYKEVRDYRDLVQILEAEIKSIRDKEATTTGEEQALHSLELQKKREELLELSQKVKKTQEEIRKIEDSVRLIKAASRGDFSDEQRQQIVQIINDASDLQKKYAAFSSGVIVDHLRKIFVAYKKKNDNRIFSMKKDKTDIVVTLDENGKIEEQYHDQLYDFSHLIGQTIQFGGTEVERKTKTVVGSAIRGGSFFSLENEAIAEAIASAAGTTSKKVTEDIIYRVLLKIITDPNINFEIPLVAANKKEFLNTLLEIHVERFFEK